MFVSLKEQAKKVAVCHKLIKHRWQRNSRVGEIISPNAHKKTLIKNSSWVLAAGRTGKLSFHMAAVANMRRFIVIIVFLWAELAAMLVWRGDEGGFK